MPARDELRDYLDAQGRKSPAELQREFDAIDEPEREWKERMPRDAAHTLASEKERPAPPARELVGRPRDGAAPRISNYKLIHPENGVGPSIKAPLTTQEIVEGIQAATNGWPKSCDGSLFVPSRAGVRWLRTGNDLHAWTSEVAGESGGVIGWGRGPDLLTMNALHSSAIELCDRFESVELFPHHPPHAASYYLLPAQMPQAGSGAFNDLLLMFGPDTEADCHLIRAFFLTLVWGGPGGKRPIFGFEAATDNGKAGQGSGKSTVPQKAGELLGGFVSIDLATDSGKDLMPRLLSAAGRRARLVIFDNVKGSRVSSSLIESSVTAPVLSGKQLFQGEGSRPNFLTWCITSNQPSLSKDLAARTYPIRVRPPKYSPEWEARINAFIAAHRWSIIADMLAELAGPPVTTKPQPWSRWAAWESDVLLRVCDLESINPTVAGRRADLDDDDTTAAAVRDSLAKWINAEKMIDPESFRIKLPAEAVAKAVENVSPHGKKITATCRWLASINVPEIQRKRTMHGRYWLWTGAGTEATDRERDWNEIPAFPA
jgi:hypothetical protein